MPGASIFRPERPILDDVKLGAVDIAGSIAREIEEETGLAPADYRAAAHWDCVVSGAAIAMMRILNVDSTGEALRAGSRPISPGSTSLNWSPCIWCARPSDFTAAMPRYVTAFLERQFAASS